MTCPDCNSRLYITDNVLDTDNNELYRKRVCKQCGKELYTIEFQIDIDENLRNNWKKFYRRNKNEK